MVAKRSGGIEECFPHRVDLSSDICALRKRCGPLECRVVTSKKALRKRPFANKLSDDELSTQLRSFLLLQYRNCGLEFGISGADHTDVQRCS